LADSEGVAFAPLNPATRHKLAGIIEPGLAPINPLDAWGTGNDFGAIFINAMLALDSDPNTGLNVWVTDLYPAGVISDTYVDLAVTRKPQFTRPLVFLANIASVVSPAHAARLRAAGIPLLMGTENGLRAIKHLLDYADFQRRLKSVFLSEMKRASFKPATDQSHSIRQVLAAASAALDEHTSKAILRAYGLATPPEALADSLDAALQAAQQIGYPVALKTAAGELHKSDKGGVILNIGDPASLGTAYQKLNATFGSCVLVQKMAPEGVELLLGLIHDPQFGPMLTLGLGGIFVEVFKDVKLLALPTTPDKVRAALLSLKAAPLLTGARGRPPVDIDSIVAAALSLSALAADLGDLIEAVDVNPLIALPDGAVAVDALIIPRSVDL
jgi:acyl-CoA synthetase (NDP forming)